MFIVLMFISIGKKGKPVWYHRSENIRKSEVFGRFQGILEVTRNIKWINSNYIVFMIPGYYEPKTVPLLAIHSTVKDIDIDWDVEKEKCSCKSRIIKIVLDGYIWKLIQYKHKHKDTQEIISVTL